MDYQKFIKELPDFYHAWGENNIEPKSTNFAEVLTTIGRITTANIMQLLNFAVSCMDKTEIYCEIGTNQGATLIGALLNNPNKFAYAIDDFANYDAPEESLLKLTDNLEQFQLSDQIYFYAQDYESFFFDLRANRIDERIGVYFYDGSHDYRSQLMGLMLVREFLANQALVIISNANWGTTKQGTWDFLAINPEANLLLDLSTAIDYHPSFGNGLIILSWDCQNRSFPTDFDWQQHQAKQEKSVITAIANLQTLERQQSEGRAIYLKALQLHAQGDLIIAEKYYQDFLLWNSDDFEGWYNLGLLYHAGERYPAAIGSFLKAQAINPEFIDLYPSLGNSFAALGETTQAIDIYSQGINLNANHVGCYLNLGNLLLTQGEIEEAIIIYRKGLEFNPDNLDLISNLQVAEEYYQQPEFLLATAHNFYSQGKYTQAINIYQKLLNLELSNPEINEPNLYFNLSDAYQRLQEFSQSIQVLQTGVNHYPFDPRLQFTLIIQLQQQGRIEEAIDQAKTAASLIPQDYVFQILQYLLVPMIYDSVEQIELYKQKFQQGLNTLQAITKLDTPEEINQAFLGISRVTNFYLAYQAYNVRDLQIQYGQLLGKIMTARYPAWVQDLPMPELGENQKIKVGYISNYLCSYSGTYWLQGWLKLHNQDQLEIYCYHMGSTVDIVTNNFQQWSYSFHHLSHDFEAVCQQILEDKLHILVFPEIGMDAPTMAMAGLRLAPIQCTAWGHPVTTGLGTIDYFLSSELMEAENAQGHYSETLIKLPNIGVAYPAPKDIPAINPEINSVINPPINDIISEVNPQVNSAINNQLYPESNLATTAPNIKTKAYFSLPEESVIYLCLQAPFKYLPQYDRIFPSIALQVPHAKFVFLRGELLRQRLDRAFTAQGLVYTDFCEFLKIPAREDYLWLNLVADVFLDTCTWSGGNTSLEAIACGLPLVTYPGEFMRGRHADSFLKMIGVTETIAKDVENYIEIAVRLGLDTSWRREIKTKMQHQQARLFDDPVCVTALEEFYLHQVLRYHQFGKKYP